MDLKISFNKENKELEDQYIPLAVERIIKDNTIQIIDSHKKHASLKDIENNVFGARVTNYKTLQKHEGMIIRYTHPNVLGRYIAQVELIGFNPENPNHNELKGELEHLANTNFSKEELGDIVVKYVS